MSRNTSFNSLINKLSTLHKKSAETTSSLLKENKQLREEVNKLRKFKNNVLDLLQFATDPTTRSTTIPTTTTTTTTTSTTPTIPVVKEESALRQEVGSDSENDGDDEPVSKNALLFVSLPCITLQLDASQAQGRRKKSRKG